MFWRGKPFCRTRWAKVASIVQLPDRRFFAADQVSLEILTLPIESFRLHQSFDFQRQPFGAAPSNTLTHQESTIAPPRIFWVNEAGEPGEAGQADQASQADQTEMDSSLLLGWFDEFCEKLDEHDASLPVPQFAPLPNHLESSLSCYFEKLLPGRPDLESDNSSSTLEHLRWLAENLVFLFCSPCHPLVQTFQSENHLAHWGIAIPSRYSVAWYPGKRLVWHELLHLLGAKDCYNKFGIDKCPEPACLMRRNPAVGVGGDKLTLCAKNIRRIQRSEVDRQTRQELKTGVHRDR